MEPNNERPGAHERDNQAEPNKDSEDTSRLELPPNPTFPPPPVVEYTRPILKKGVYAEREDIHPGIGERQNNLNTAARLGVSMSAGITFASSVIVSVLLGLWIDKRFEPHSVPWATMALTVLGFVAGIVNFMRISSATDEGSKRR